MKALFRASVFVFGAAALAALLAPAAKAGCGEGLLKQSAFSLSRPDDFSPRVPVSSAPSMVGMWDEKFVAGGKQIDFGYSVWHSDGTEFLNSGGRAPVTQNYCLGVWTKTGAYTYQLNHLALSYDNSGNLNARVQIKEDITLANDGMTFAGKFTIDVYDPAKGTTLLQHVAGTITGKRVTMKTSTAVS